MDISWNMLLVLKDKMRSNSHNYSRVNLVLSDIENLPFRINSFDLIFALTSLQNIPDPIRGVNELYNVSKGGAIYHYSILRKNFYMKALVSVLESKSARIDFIDKENIEDIIFQGTVIKK